MKNDFSYPKMFESKSEFEMYTQENIEQSVEQETVIETTRPELRTADIYLKTAGELLLASGQKDVIPVDLKRILKLYDISAIPFDFSQLEKEANISPRNSILGALVVTSDSAAIFYNEKDAENSHRYRFTIAHEIAHCCLGSETVNLGDSEAQIDFRYEKEEEDTDEIAANTFAGELLIPEHSLKRIMSELIAPSLHTLADIFEVSTNVMRARLDFLHIDDKIWGYNC